MFIVMSRYQNNMPMLFETKGGYVDLSSLPA